jgi:hypothetical protein
VDGLGTATAGVGDAGTELSGADGQVAGMVPSIRYYATHVLPLPDVLFRSDVLNIPLFLEDRSYACQQCS